jgi:hypothetical protein
MEPLLHYGVDIYVTRAQVLSRCMCSDVRRFMCTQVAPEHSRRNSTEKKRKKVSRANVQMRVHQNDPDEGVVKNPNDLRARTSDQGGHSPWYRYEEARSPQTESCRISDT